MTITHHNKIWQSENDIASVDEKDEFCFLGRVPNNVSFGCKQCQVRKRARCIWRRCGMCNGTKTGFLNNFISSLIFSKSYPMHHRNVSKNFDWHPWNNDPSIEVPDEYEGMVVQPLGDRQKVYDDLISGCVEHYGERGLRCVDSEKDRVEMSLRQPKVRKGVGGNMGIRKMISRARSFSGHAQLHKIGLHQN